MKYRLAGIIALVVVLSVAIASSFFHRESDENRFHQHLSARQPDAGCSCAGTELCTHLPLVIIETNGEEIPGVPIENKKGEEIGYTTTEEGESMLSAKISIMSRDDRNHHPSDQPDLQSDILIRIRGNSSRYFEKKGYLVRFINEEGSYRKEEMMGMSAHYEWALHGPYMDKTMIRNYMWYNISAEFMGYTPNVRFCEVIIDGEYQGLYVMTETITNGDDCRLNISEPIQGTEKTGYLLRVDMGSIHPLKNPLTFSQYTYRMKNKLDIQYPRAGDLTPYLTESIAQDFSDFEKNLYSYDYDTDDHGYYYDINVQSFVDYFIINEFTVNYDVGALSTYIYRDIGGKFNMVIWDFNSACDNYIDSMTDPQRFELPAICWYFMLMKDEYFTNQIIDRYRELRESYLSEEYLNQYIDDTIAYLGDAVERNFSVWGKTFQMDLIHPSERNPRTYDQAVAQLKNFISERGQWMDENIEVLKQYSHESRNKKYNH
ncbi:MAG: CotH kinase family protein [Massiliimalia sp.]|jgi:hypothetical protein